MLILSSPHPHNPQLILTSSCRRFLPLHLAAASNPSLQVVQAIVANGGESQLDATDSSGRTPLHLAAYSNPNDQVAHWLAEGESTTNLPLPVMFGSILTGRLWLQRVDCVCMQTKPHMARRSVSHCTYSREDTCHHNPSGVPLFWVYV